MTRGVSNLLSHRCLWLWVPAFAGTTSTRTALLTFP
jgi:hypothetical protein